MSKLYGYLLVGFRLLANRIGLDSTDFKNRNLVFWNLQALPKMTFLKQKTDAITRMTLTE